MPCTERRNPVTRLAASGRRLLLVLAVAMAAVAPALADRPIRLVFSEESAPLAFEKNGQPRGIEVDVAREVLTARLGQPVEITVYPWERAQKMVRAGEADGFISVATPERKTYASCGVAPVLRSPMRVVMRRNHPQLEQVETARSLDDLRRFELVSYLGNGWAHDRLAGFKVYDAVDFPASLRGLAQGRADIALVNALSGLYYLDQLKLTGKLLVLPQDFDTVDYVLCLGKTSPHVAILGEFDRVLDVLRADGGYARILATYGLAPDASY